MKLLIHGYARFSHYASHLQSPLLLLVRLYWGWQFIQTGWGKLHNLTGVTTFFSSLNIPFPAVTAHFIAGLEFFGGILLLAGLGSRIIALLLVVNMTVAYYTADHAALLSIFSDPGKFYAAAPFTFLIASLLILVFGAGLFSADTLLRRYSTAAANAR